MLVVLLADEAEKIRGALFMIVVISVRMGEHERKSRLLINNCVCSCPAIMLYKQYGRLAHRCFRCLDILKYHNKLIVTEK